jgi:hypothetical protein
MRGDDLYKSHDVDGVEDTGGVFNMGGKGNGGIGGMKGYVYSSLCSIFVQLVLLVNEHNTS